MSSLLRGCCRAFLALALGLQVAAALAQSQPVGEYEVKAAFLYNFAKFVEWPAAALPQPDTPLRICVTGPESLETDLQQLIQNRTVDGHPLQVLRVRNREQINNCHILFLAARQERAPAGFHGGFGPGILTVGETEGLANEGIVINFVWQENRIAFEIDVDAAHRAGVTISSKLLSLATIVRHDTRGGNN